MNSNQLFTGIAESWYEQRLQHMYKTVPKCSQLYIENHLLGLCPNCGMGRYARSKYKPVQIVIGRVYTIMFQTVNDIDHLKFALTKWPSLLTNVEYPIPRIQYRDYHRTPMFVDVESRTIIDFQPRNNATKYQSMALAEYLEKANFQYKVFSKSHDLMYSSPNSSKRESLRLEIGDMATKLCQLTELLNK